MTCLLTHWRTNHLSFQSWCEGQKFLSSTHSRVDDKPSHALSCPDSPFLEILTPYPSLLSCVELHNDLLTRIFGLHPKASYFHPFIIGRSNLRQ